MLRIFIIQKLINFFDYFQQKKIFDLLKKKLGKEIIIFDVGAHHGETIKKFIKNFDLEKIHSFEASSKNFKKLVKNTKNCQFKNIVLNNVGRIY